MQLHRGTPPRIQRTLWGIKYAPEVSLHDACAKADRAIRLGTKLFYFGEKAQNTEALWQPYFIINEKFDQSVLRECTGHHLDALSDDTHFGISAGLIKPWPANKHLARMLQQFYEVGDLIEVNTAKQPE